MRTALVGAVESSAVALRTLAASGSPVDAVLTLPREHLHRHSDGVDLRPIAEELGTPVISTSNVNDSATISALEEVRPDTTLVVGWSQICRREFLEVAKWGTIGYHPSALPANRGRAVIPWTILQGATQTGSSLFWMNEGMDTGDILFQERLSVEPRETATTLYAKHMNALERMLGRISQSADGRDLPRQPQDHARATYCSQRTPEDGRIDWSMSAVEIDRLVRATTDPYPGAFSTLDGRELTIWESEPIHVPYFGVPGQVQFVGEEGPVIQCGHGTHLIVRRSHFRDDPSAGPPDLRRQSRLDTR